MNKMQMAHDMALAMAANGNVPNEDIVAIVWQYADAMQAKADEREDKTRPQVLEEWQPDWSQAPEWANWWSVDENGTANFSGKKPHIEGHQWVYYSAAGEKPSHIEAPSFSYQGNWRESQRKRPQ